MAWVGEYLQKLAQAVYHSLIPTGFLLQGGPGAAGGSVSFVLLSPQSAHHLVSIPQEFNSRHRNPTNLERFD